jgi:transposase-like protein
MSDEKPEVMVKCKRGTDRLTEGESCDSKLAYQLSQPGSSVASFKCKKCGFSWNVPLGGSFVGV